MNSKLKIFIFGLLIIISELLTPNSELYGQDDYLEMKGNTKTDTLTFTGDRADFPSTPVKGEVFYNSTDKLPYHFNGTNWTIFGAAGQDRYVASRIVAASDSSGTTCGGGSCTNPKADFTCDGTDDQQEINRAINDMYANGRNGGAVYLLEGTYNISWTLLEGETRRGIVPHSNTAIIGTGRGTVLRLSGTGDNLNIIYARNVNCVLVSQLMIDGNGQTGTNIDGIEFQSVTNSKIDQVWVENVKDDGIHIESSNNNIISNNDVRGTGDDGIDVDTSSSNNIIFGNNIQTNTNNGINIESSSNNTITGNIVWSNGDEGIVLTTSSQGNTISSNIVRLNHTRGIMVYESSSNSFLDNEIGENGSDGTYLKSVSSSNIVGNNIWGNGAVGIFLHDFSNDNIISNNVIYDNGQEYGISGIFIENSSNNNIISSNLLFDSNGTGFPIELTNGSDNNYLVGNLVSTWPATYNTINDTGTNTKYTDKVKVTLERRTISPGSATWTLDVATDPRSYVYLTPTVNITKLVFANGKAAGDLLILENGSSSSKTITIKEADNPTNLNLEYNLDGLPPPNRSLLGQYDTLKLIWNGTRWLEMEYVNN